MKVKALLLFLLLSARSFSQIPRLCGMTFGISPSFNNGTIFEINGDSSAFSTLHRFDCNHGGFPVGNLIQLNNGKVYGICTIGNSCNGTNDGKLFSFNITDSTYTVLITFNGSNGKSPSYGLTKADNGKLYGMTSDGGIGQGWGTVYSFDPSNNNFSIVHNFDSLNGAIPYNGLEQGNDGKLYGITTYGGIHNRGVVFSLDTLTGNFIKLHDFDTPTGIEPLGKLIQATDSKLYGTTRLGGTHNCGVLFNYDLSSNLYTDIFDFDSINGRNPEAPLIQATNGKLYGVTSQGGSDSTKTGVLFTYNPDSNIFSKLYDFDISSGHEGWLNDIMQASDGMIYGITQFEGLYQQGTIFKFNPVNNSFTKLHDFDLADFGNSHSGLIELMPGTGIKENETDAEFYIYPNPTSSYITINSSISFSHLLIRDAIGRILITPKLPANTTHKELDISELAAGVYFVTVESERGKVTKKLVIR